MLSIQLSDDLNQRRLFLILSIVVVFLHFLTPCKCWPKQKNILARPQAIRCRGDSPGALLFLQFSIVLSGTVFKVLPVGRLRRQMYLKMFRLYSLLPLIRCHYLEDRFLAVAAVLTLLHLFPYSNQGLFLRRLLFAREHNRKTA
jgi:hypothetical protein